MTLKGKYAKIYKCVVPRATTAQKRFLNIYDIPSRRVLENEGGKKMKAVIETGGKQYYVTEGTELYIEKLDLEAGKKVKFDKVLMANDEIGHPYLTNVEVTGEVVKNGKAKKIVIFKYVSKSRSNRKKQGHRQPYTKIVIKSIKVK